MGVRGKRSTMFCGRRAPASCRRAIRSTFAAPIAGRNYAVSPAEVSPGVIRNAHGRLCAAIPDLDARFEAQVEPEPNSGCWLFVGTVNATNGYGRFHDGKRDVLAHRFSYERRVGCIPDTLTLDHLCRNRQCVNPQHLEPVPLALNIRRGVRVRTHCPHGHAYEGRNIMRPRGHLACRRCHVIRQTERNRRLGTSRKRTNTRYDPAQRRAKYLRMLVRRVTG